MSAPASVLPTMGEDKEEPASTTTAAASQTAEPSTTYVSVDPPMPSTYQASLNCGVYGGYWLNENVDTALTEVAMPSTYKASLNCGVYGGYLLSENAGDSDDDIPVCKYVKREDLKMWTNRIPAPDLQIYAHLRFHQSTDDEIYEQMLKDELPAYWINKFFIYL